MATSKKATMIVIGTRGMGKVKRTFVSSVSDYVLHHAHCPVVICRYADSVLAKKSEGIEEDMEKLGLITQ